MYVKPKNKNCYCSSPKLMDSFQRWAKKKLFTIHVYYETIGSKYFVLGETFLV